MSTAIIVLLIGLFMIASSLCSYYFLCIKKDNLSNNGDNESEKVFKGYEKNQKKNSIRELKTEHLTIIHTETYCDVQENNSIKNSPKTVLL
jgi:hypothetical protein